MYTARPELSVELPCTNAYTVSFVGMGWGGELESVSVLELGWRRKDVLRMRLRSGLGWEEKEDCKERGWQ